MYLSRVRLHFLTIFLTVVASACGQEKDGAVGPSPSCQLPPVSARDLKEKAIEFSGVHGVRTVIAKEDCKENALLSCEGVDEKDYGCVYDFLDKMKHELDVYPSGLLSKIKLKAFLFLDELADKAKNLSQGMGSAGITLAIGDSSVILFNLQALRRADAKIYKRLLHHEIGHALDYGLLSEPMSRALWAKLNPQDFRYGNYTEVAGGWLEFSHPQTGFLSKYGTVNAAEDFAEFYSVMHFPESGSDLRNWISEDKNLKAKLIYMLYGINQTSSAFVSALPNYSGIRDLLKQ